MFCIFVLCHQCFSALKLLVWRQERHPAHKNYGGGWWRWELVSPDGVAPSRMVSVSASVNLPLHHKVQKFSSGSSSPGWSRKKGRKTVVVWWCDVMSLRSWCCYGCQIFIICWFPFRVVKRFSKIQFQIFYRFWWTEFDYRFGKCAVHMY